MGGIIARFRKKPSTMESLEALEKDITALLKFKRRNQQLEKHYIGMLLLYSILMYIIVAVVYYFYYFPDNWKGKVVCSLPLLMFPFIIWGLKKLLHWYFIKRTRQNDFALDELRDKKKKILDEVMEKETYKTAKEILEKFDPTFKKQESPPPRVAMPPQVGVRQRPVGRGRGAPVAPNRNLNGQQMAIQRPILTPRPILPRDRGTMDKFVEYLVGDGPNSRYALICKNCYSHNGMALAEEFEYLAFKCAYCHSMNPSRKTRPNAPPLAVALPGTPPLTPRRQPPTTSTQQRNQPGQPQQQQPQKQQQQQQASVEPENNQDSKLDSGSESQPSNQQKQKEAEQNKQVFTDDDDVSEDMANDVEDIQVDVQISEDELAETLQQSDLALEEKSAEEKKTD